MRNVAIIQARMGSSRLPGKMLMALAGRPVIEHVVARARRISGLDAVAVATTVSPVDDALAACCKERGFPVFRGSEQDVLDRYVQAARHFEAEVIMRLTGDCPLLDPRESGRVLAAFLAEPGCEYACNIEPPFLPDGLDTEVVRQATLERVWATAAEQPYREHVTYYIRRHLKDFKSLCLHGDRDLSHHRWTLDEERDFLMLSGVAEELTRRGQFGYLDEVLAILAERPELTDVNKQIQRDEGLARSLKQNPLKGR